MLHALEQFFLCRHTIAQTCFRPYLRAVLCSEVYQGGKSASKFRLVRHGSSVIRLITTALYVDEVPCNVKVGQGTHRLKHHQVFSIANIQDEAQRGKQGV